MPRIMVEDTTDKWFKEIESDMSYLEGHQIEYGYFEEDSHPSGYPTATIAFWNNYGTQKEDGSGWHIPPRDFFDLADSFVNEDMGKYDKLIIKSIVTGGRETLKTTMKYVGDQAADSIRDAIDTQSFKELAPSTVAKKGSDVQLIETNTMYDQAKYKLTRKGKGNDD